MAKEIAMLQRNEKSKEVRKYFIQVEKDFNSPEKIMARALLMADKKIKLLENQNENLLIELEEATFKLEMSASKKPKATITFTPSVTDVDEMMAVVGLQTSMSELDE
ncbi:Uncharacterised protein [Streptococcus salivarius]|nr:Uncharacterised protein [Streptococcus salivarius]VUW83919.1 Uncharacterised protein [Streptococcus thermophilus]